MDPSESITVSLPTYGGGTLNFTFDPDTDEPLECFKISELFNEKTGAFILAIAEIENQKLHFRPYGAVSLLKCVNRCGFSDPELRLPIKNIYLFACRQLGNKKFYSKFIGDRPLLQESQELQRFFENLKLAVEGDRDSVKKVAQTFDEGLNGKVDEDEARAWKKIGNNLDQVQGDLTGKAEEASQHFPEQKSIDCFDDLDPKAAYQAALKLMDNDILMFINSGQAFQLMLHSAESGYEPAIFLIADFYRNGIGTEKNENEEQKWMEMAAVKSKREEPKPERESSSDRMEPAPTSPVFTEDKPLNAMMIYQAAGNGDRESRFQLGLMLSNGDRVEQNLPLAVYYYELASEQGHSRASNDLGWLYEHGIGVEKNHKLAIKYYSAGRKGSIMARANYYRMVATRCEGTKEERDEAVKQFMDLISDELWIKYALEKSRLVGDDLEAIGHRFLTPPELSSPQYN